MEQDAWERPKTNGSYLEKLNEEELWHIFRFMSARPLIANWHHQIAPEDALNLLRYGGPLGAFAKSKLRRLSVMEKVDNYRALVVSGTVEKTAELFEGLLTELGPVLQELSFSSLSVNATLLKSWKKCLTLRSLRIGTRMDVDNVRALLEACSGNLRELAISDGLCPQSIKIIAEHCTGVTKFEVASREGIRRVTRNFLRDLMPPRTRRGSGLGPIWRTIGSTLVDLSIDMNAQYCTEVPGILMCEIVHYCVNVRSLEYRCRRSATMHNSRAVFLVHLCEKFGSQLKQLRLPRPRLCLTEAQANRIFMACPDLLVDIHVHLRCERLSVFEDRVRSLKLRGEVIGNVELAGEGVPSLQKLSVYGFHTDSAVRFLKSFFSSPKACLKALHIDLVALIMFSDNDSNPFDVVAQVVTTLETICVGTSAIYPGLFYKIAKANQGLKSVTISDPLYNVEPGLLTDQETAVASCVEDFSQCPLLKEILVDNRFLKRKSVKIAAACLLFRHRNVEIFIGGRQYNMLHRKLQYSI